MLELETVKKQRRSSELRMNTNQFTVERRSQSVKRRGSALLTRSVEKPGILKTTELLRTIKE